MPGRAHIHTPKFRRCVEHLQDKGYEDDSAYAICTATFQKAGEEYLASESEQQLADDGQPIPWEKHTLGKPYKPKRKS